MENLEPFVSRNDLDLYNILFKHILPLPVMYGTHPADRAMWNTNRYYRAETDKNYPEIAEFLWAGSKHEGLFVPISENKPNSFVYLMSDIDLITVLNGFIADDRIHPSTQPPHIEMLNIRSASHAGYIRLSSKANEIFSMRYDSDCSGAVHFIRNNTISGRKILPMEEIIHKKICPLISYTEKFVHGPALCYRVKTEHLSGDTKKGVSSGSDIDVVLALKMSSWPLTAKEWVDRRRNSRWPSKELIEHIIKSDMYIVSVGHPDSDESENEWRYSFTMPEKCLGQSLGVFQRACYCLAKILLKSAIPNSEGISSYFLKTLLFWVCEEIPEEEWKTDKMGYFVMLLIYRLKCCLQKKELRHYFIPENNMMDHIQPKILTDAIKQLSVLLEDPLSLLFRFTEQTKYYGFYIHPPNEMYQPLISLFKERYCAVQVEVLNPVLNGLLWEFVRHYCSWLKKDIAPPGDSITRPFAEMKFRLLLNTAKDIQETEISKPFDEIIEFIAKEIRNYNVGNATEFKCFAKSNAKIF
ncbi:uncharacterized protein LOC127708433 [Mytilus californianus]|uniref:uncharacterized protein LOC127708433 n=1 Tax=Mytilus californianus TaxID=6549 RepID=UPI0022486DD8|nr:uncharacterized protein LOC127708433 [Mytilus californianus]